MPPDRSKTGTEANRQAWNAQRYEAWSTAYGGPVVEAARIVADPARPIRRLIPYIGDVSGKRVCHVQGSHGRIAAALALLGAEVRVIDFSDANRRFALDLAAAAGVTIDYAVCDIMDAGELALPHGFDVLVLEMGVLHYHQNLARFFTVLRRLAEEGGLLVLNEFHPVQRKLYWPDGPHDYFHDGLVEADVPNPDAAGASLGRCQYRFWTMAEALTAVIDAGFAISKLDEHPDWSDPTNPGSFTLVAQA